MNRVVLLVGALALTAAGCAGSRTSEPTGGAAASTSSGPTAEPSTRTAETTVPPTTTDPSATTTSGATPTAASTPTTSGTTATEPPATTGPATSSTSAPTDPGTRPMSSTVLPTLQPPTAPPSLPSDQLTGLWVVGTVTAGTAGGCATVSADDGRVLALSGGSALTAGDRVKVRVVQPPRPVYCGDVEAWTLLEVTAG